MKKLYKIISLTFICVGTAFAYSQIFAETEPVKRGYELYKERNKVVCTEYEPDGIIYKTEAYPKV